MRKKVIFITGAAGEVGLDLIRALAADNSNQILSLDLQALPADLDQLTTHVVGDILNKTLLSRLVSQYEIHTIYHLAALLSKSSEFTPEIAHEVNVEGTLNLLKLGCRAVPVAQPADSGHLPLLYRHLRHAGNRTGQNALPTGARMGMEPAADHVWLQQTVL